MEEKKTGMGLTDFRLPGYQEIPGVGLYLNQVVTFVNEITEPLLHTQVTPTMLSNYVKLHLVGSPVKKMYSREQVAELLFIVLVKNVLSLDNIRVLLKLREKTESAEAAYDYFRRELEETLRQTCAGAALAPRGAVGGSARALLREVVVTLVQKIYLDTCFCEFAASESETDK